jgi:hypothetical protein
MTSNGQAGGGLAEAGLAIDYDDGLLTVGPIIYSPVNTVTIPLSISVAIAMLHTHGNQMSGMPTLPTDANKYVPNYVRSRVGLYVTNPENGTFSKALSEKACK